MAIMNFNYNQAISQANQVEKIAKDMLAIANKQIQNAGDSIEICWRGSASQQFIANLEATQADIRAQAKKLQDLAKRIRSVAKIIEEAEQRAKELLRQKDAASKNGSGFGGGGGGF